MRLSYVLLLVATASFANEEEDFGNVAPLFTDHSIIDVTITAPFKEIMETRSLEDELPATLAYRDATSGEDVTLEIKIRSRGKFRRKKEVCNFTPLRLNFRQTKGTLFAKSDKMKLVPHCRSGISRYESLVPREYIAYRILNTLTDWSFRVRPLQARYVESTTGKEIASAFAFLIEEDGQLAKRIGMKVDESETTTIPALDSVHTNIVSVHQYLIGNTDFSPINGVPGEPCCHNFILLSNDATQISVPYDFDVTGIVGAPYAMPNERFGLTSVKQRLYRGRCWNDQHLDTTLQLFRDKQAEIYDLVNNQQGMTGRDKKSVIRYINEFYKTLDSDRKIKRQFRDSCLGRARAGQTSPQ
jgi:hypothetical protein